MVAAGVIGMLSWTNRWFDPGTSAFTAAEIARTYADTLVLGLAAGWTQHTGVRGPGRGPWTPVLGWTDLVPRPGPEPRAGVRRTAVVTTA